MEGGKFNMDAGETLKLISKQWCDLNDLRHNGVVLIWKREY